MVTAKALDPLTQVEIIAAETPLGQYDRHVGGKWRRAKRSAIKHHAREPRRQRQRPQAVSRIGDATVVIDCPQFAQQNFGFGERRLRRRIEEEQSARIGHTPMREIEHQRGEVGSKDFRRGKRQQRPRLPLIPEPVADAGLRASGAPAALVGGCLRHPHGFEPREAEVRLVARHAGKSTIDHDAHAFDRQRGFRDRGREHHLAPSARRRRDGAILHLRVQRPVKRHDIDGVIRHFIAEQAFDPADLGRAR